MVMWWVAILSLSSTCNTVKQCFNSVTINKGIGDTTMSRPKPTVLLEAVNKHTYKSEQILSADAIYSVFYQMKPINLRVLNTLISYPGPKYKKVSFSNPGHAFNLAERLNKRFSTTDFSVVRLTHGEVINEEDITNYTG